MTNKEIKNLVVETVKNTINDIFAEWIANDIDSAILTSAGWVIFEKRKLNKDFCFGYGTSEDSYDKAIEMSTIAKNDPKYFISDNLKWYDNILEKLESGDNYYVSAYDNYPNAPFIHIVNASMMYSIIEKNSKIKHGQLSDKDTKELIEFVKKLRAKQEKRCNTYLKKYGMRKIKTWTYDIWD